MKVSSLGSFRERGLVRVCEKKRMREGICLPQLCEASAEACAWDRSQLSTSGCRVQRGQMRI